MESPVKQNTFLFKLSPLFIAIAMFVLIRLSHDFTANDDYFKHSLFFILSELSSIVVGTYLCFYLTLKWSRYVLANKPSAILEYAAVILFAIILVVGVMSLSHGIEDSYLTFGKMVGPCVVAVLCEVWEYLWIKTSMLDKKYHESLINNERMRNEQLITEMKLLQAQYHPHFLFNMLNAIYFRIDENNERARDAVEHLSNLLRGQLYPKEGKVALENELSVLESFIELSRLRFSDSLDLTVDIDNSSFDAMIYPYILLPLVENAFKHVGGKKEIIVRLKCDGQMILLDVCNTVDAVPKMRREDGGIGLQNLKSRLDLFYGGARHDLEVSCADGWFNAKLVLEL